jgi:RNA polymerase sigma-70 factor (sigma-E family)
VTAQRDAEYADYVAHRLPALRRLALLLCQDRHRADDLVQQAIIKVYVHWTKAAGADNRDAYVNAILVREFLHDRRSGWVTRVSLTGQLPDAAALTTDHDRAMDLQAAVAALPPRQRAALVLRFYCDLNVDQTAHTLSCSPGTVKSQTAKALDSLRRVMEPAAEVIHGTRPYPGKAADHA